MNRTVLLILFLFLAIGLFADDNQIIPIRVLEIEGDNHTNRGQDNVPIIAFYMIPSSSVRVVFLHNIGIVDINISNMSNGNSEDFQIDSHSFQVSLPICGSVGIYRITFRSANGVEYEGLFEIPNYNFRVTEN